MNIILIILLVVQSIVLFDAYTKIESLNNKNKVLKRKYDVLKRKHREMFDESIKTNQLSFKKITYKPVTFRFDRYFPNYYNDTQIKKELALDIIDEVSKYINIVKDKTLLNECINNKQKIIGNIILCKKVGEDNELD